MDEIQAAAEIIVPSLPPEDEIQHAVNAAVEEMTEKPKRIHRAKPLTPKQAVTKFWNRGIYVIFNDDLDVDPNHCGERKNKYIVRCRCSPACKTSFASWDSYAYNRHFSYKKHLKWEGTRKEMGWDEGEAYRDFVKFIEMTLEDSEEEEEEEEHVRGRKRGRKSVDEKALNAQLESKSVNKPSEERRKQELHYMNLWREARSELKAMRQELKEEKVAEAIEELKADIAGLKKKKEEWARLLGIEGCDV